MTEPLMAPARRTKHPAVRSLGFRSFRLQRVGRELEALPFIERTNGMSAFVFFGV